MRVDALLAQHRHPGTRQLQCGCKERLRRVKRQVHMQTRVCRIASGGVFGIGSRRVVALLANLPAHGIPDLVQVLQRRLEHRFGVAPDLHFALADFQRSVLWPGFADEVAEL